MAMVIFSAYWNCIEAWPFWENYMHIHIRISYKQIKYNQSVMLLQEQIIY